jgi:hypothetical protein
MEAAKNVLPGEVMSSSIVRSAAHLAGQSSVTFILLALQTI